MENLKEKVLRPLINVIPFPIIKRIGSCKLIILYYHTVSDEYIPHVEYLYKYKSTKLFFDDLEFLLKNYYPIGLLDVIHWVKDRNQLPPNCFLLTFDDGLRQIYDVIAPILLNKGIPSTFFISSAFVDNGELCYLHKKSLLVEKIKEGISAGDESEIREFLLKRGFLFTNLYKGVLKIDYRRKHDLDRIADIINIDFKDYLNENQPYLTSEQIMDLINRGFTVGAHSIDHPYYSTLSLEEQLEQTIVSVKGIREKFGLEYGAFAFPHNDSGVSQEFFRKIQETNLVDITFGTGGMLDNDLWNHRQRISLEKPLLTARQLIAWQYSRKIYRQLIRNKKV